MHTDYTRAVDRQTVRRTRGCVFCDRRDRRSLLVRDIRHEQARGGQRGRQLDSGAGRLEGQARSRHINAKCVHPI